MAQELVDKLLADTEGMDENQLMAFALETFGDEIALASSFGAEDQVLTDMLCKISKEAKIFTLDTGRLHQATYSVMEKTRMKYGIQLHVMFPQTQDVQEMVNEHGLNLFYESIENRKRCCGVRKIEPLRRFISENNLQAWFVGLRKEQSPTREDMKWIQWDEGNQIIKICPLLDWSTDQVWDYIKNNGVPYNALHDQGFPSIGCEPCTRAIQEGQDIRAGRWWWENPDQKECGLHK